MFATPTVSTFVLSFCTTYASFLKPHYPNIANTRRIPSDWLELAESLALAKRNATSGSGNGMYLPGSNTRQVPSDWLEFAEMIRLAKKTNNENNTGVSSASFGNAIQPASHAPVNSSLATEQTYSQYMPQHASNIHFGSFNVNSGPPSYSTYAPQIGLGFGNGNPLYNSVPQGETRSMTAAGMRSNDQSSMYSSMHMASGMQNFSQMGADHNSFNFLDVTTDAELRSQFRNPQNNGMVLFFIIMRMSRLTDDVHMPTGNITYYQ